MASLWDYLSNVPDVAKSFGTGVVNSLGELAGLPGDLNSVVAKTAQSALGPIPQFQYRYDIQPPTSEEIKNGITAPLQHTPQTQGGQMAMSLGEALAPLASGMGVLNARNKAMLGPLANEILTDAMMQPHNQAAMAIQASMFPALMSRPPGGQLPPWVNYFLNIPTPNTPAY